jgi:AraC-like DNA-binding protein
MLNFYDYVANSKYFKTFKVSDLLVVEYKCPLPGEKVTFWTHYNYFAYILSGVTKYSTGNNEYIVQNGDGIFVRKGSYIGQRHGSGDYCALIIFVSDDLIQKVIDKYTGMLTSFGRQSNTEPHDAIISLNLDNALTGYFHSVLSYFSMDVAPPDELLKVKVEELLLNILTSGQNRSLALCLRHIRENGKVCLRDVMETSFLYPMSMAEYARLCGRSLSTFKSDFQETYKTTPGKWLIRKRLQHGKLLIESTDDPVNDIAFKSGFKNTAHFVKVFKDEYGMPPNQYRAKALVS